MKRVSFFFVENCLKKIQNDRPGRWQGSDEKFCSAHSAKIAFYNGVFRAINQIIKQHATFLITFSIP